MPNHLMNDDFNPVPLFCLVDPSLLCRFLEFDALLCECLQNIFFRQEAYVPEEDHCLLYALYAEIRAVL